MRNESRVIKLKNNWVLKVTFFSRKKEFGLGITREDWGSNDFSTKIFLDYKACRKLARVLQSFLDKLKAKESVKNGKEEVIRES